jgi:hypothetical protein
VQGLWSYRTVCAAQQGFSVFDYVKEKGREVQGFGNRDAGSWETDGVVSRLTDPAGRQAAEN